MRDRRVEELLEAQGGIVAGWQLRAAECSEGVIEYAARTLRIVHSGVYLSGHAPPSDWQLWKAATITAPGTFLADWSASSFLTMRDRADRMPTTVVRRGSGSTRHIKTHPDRIGSLRIRRALIHPNEIVEKDGIESIGVPRTTLDQIARMQDPAADRLVREVLRRKLATAVELRACTAQHHGERGVGRMKALIDVYGPLPLHRSKSDAEALGLAILAAAGFDPPAHNVVIEGGEADYAWFDRKHITELDGPQYHQFPEFDAKKQDRWERAGWTVSRLPTDDVYDNPHLLLAAAESPGSDARNR